MIKYNACLCVCGGIVGRNLDFEDLNDIFFKLKFYDCVDLSLGIYKV